MSWKIPWSIVACSALFASTAAAGDLYLVDEPAITRTELDGTGSVLLLNAPGASFIALDTAAGKMYWTTFSFVQRANLDGTSLQTIVSGLTEGQGIAVDPAGGKVYWGDETTGKVQRANLDGTGVEDLVTGLGKPVGIGLDTGAGKLYWSDEGTLKIQRANLDGSGVEDLVTTGLSKPVGLDLDLVAGKIYWGDQVAQRVQRSNLDGTSVENVIASGAGAVRDVKLDVSGGKLYWTDDNSGALRRANLDGSGQEILPATAFGIAVNPSGTATPWTDLGSGLAGVSGVPSLVGTGTLVPGSAGDLTLTNAAPLKFAVLFVSFASTPTPFKGGTLVTVPPLLGIGFTTSGTGGLLLPWASWPAGLPTGTALFFQCAIVDAAAPVGVSLSNALKAVTP